ncbi:MAG TPA: DNA topoisomerase VI subunit B [Bdellovibrionales bacterium]|nr:DNA topoisomerase VI subunit B [Bdellovibrionales bacterium]
MEIVKEGKRRVANTITSSSTAEYFAKNLQQVGFSSPTKAVLTTLKEAVDNSLDACESHGIQPELWVEILKVGPGSQKNTDAIQIAVEDNGPGIDPDDLTKVFGEYLASSKFGRGQCSRGQQGIGISAATTWAQLTSAAGATVITKTAKMRKAVKALVEVDIKSNRGVLKKKETIDWDKESGVRVEFRMDGRIQLNGDGGLMTYLEGTTLVNPHVTLNYKLPDAEWVKVERVSQVVPEIPAATLPHPHTMKLGEFMTYAHLHGKITLRKWLKSSFSRITDSTFTDFVKNGLPKNVIDQPIAKITDEQFKTIFKAIHDTELMSPSTKSVLSVGEESLAKSISRLGEVDFLSVVTRKPRICDFKPVVVEVALARFKNRGDEDSPVQVLRFANRVPLQFDKAACAITHAIESVNWKSYGLGQPKESVPLGPYVFAVSVVSPFIKFKNASKETVDASDELVEEIRRALMQAGQKLSRHIRREHKEADLERKLAHIEQFGPILVDGLVRIIGANEKRKKKAEEGLRKLLGRDAAAAEDELAQAHSNLETLKKKESYLASEDGAGDGSAEGEAPAPEEGGQLKFDTGEGLEDGRGTGKSAGTTKKAATTAKKTTAKKGTQKQA